MSWSGNVATVPHNDVGSGILAPFVISMMLCSSSMWFEVLYKPVVLLSLFVTKILEFCLCLWESQHSLLRKDSGCLGLVVLA
jgi:hypothetical protein